MSKQLDSEETAAPPTSTKTKETCALLQRIDTTLAADRSQHRTGQLPVLGGGPLGWKHLSDLGFKDVLLIKSA
ncbi:MAG: hypothetical protein NT154_47415 [Verrucomicrobia bacterium]|nr:hypothetical protein [Verrucomicrobiota bacterium]